MISLTDMADMTGEAAPAAGGWRERRATRPRILVVAYSNVGRDSRVLRQLEYLSRAFDVIAAGHGESAGNLGVRWYQLPSRRNPVQRLLGHLLLLVGRVWRGAYPLWFRLRPAHRVATEVALRERCSLYYANDWLTLPAAASGAAKHAGKLVFDAHEYSPLEWESSATWRLLYRPLVLWTLREYVPVCAASLTVSEPIAERYGREYGLRPTVIMNAPRIDGELPQPVPLRDHVRLVHHGSAIRERRLELMIDAVSLAHQRYMLELMLLGDSDYIEFLRRYANTRATGRVTFRTAVPPGEIVRTLAEYDMGLYLLDTDMYNHAMAMPNKFLDFVAAGLAVCIGPSPTMRQLVEQYGFGCISPSIEPRDCAGVLNRVTAVDVASMKAAARIARKQLNADVEMGKLMRVVTALT